MTQGEWIWMPHGAHHILRDRCAFRLATYVGGYIVSTVGEVIPLDRKSTDYQNVGSGRLYEVYVFKAVSRGGDSCVCCPYEIDLTDCDTVETYGCNDPAEATAKHMQLCKKYSEINELEELLQQ